MQQKHGTVTASSVTDRANTPTSSLRGMSFEAQQTALMPDSQDFASQSAALVPVQLKDGPKQSSAKTTVTGTTSPTTAKPTTETTSSESTSSDASIETASTETQAPDVFDETLVDSLSLLIRAPCMEDAGQAADCKGDGRTKERLYQRQAAARGRSCKVGPKPCAARSFPGRA
jgi:hypothetical protein